MSVTFKQEIVFFNDSFGRIVPNAKIQFYEAGTTTPKNTYVDNDLSSTNPWPVVSDGSGVFPPIFLETGGYKIVVLDEDDAVIRTRDNINVVESELSESSAIYFDTLVDLKQGITINDVTVSLEIGQIAKTAGNDENDDGEGAEWLIVASGTGTSDDFNYVNLDSGLQAQRINKYGLGVKTSYDEDFERIEILEDDDGDHRIVLYDSDGDEAGSLEINDDDESELNATNVNATSISSTNFNVFTFSGRWNVSSSGWSLSKGTQPDSVTKNGTGDFTVTVSTTTTDVHSFPLVQAMSTSADSVISVIETITSSTPSIINISFFDEIDIPTDPDFFILRY